ncbi:hypothetical protein B9G55_18130 [Saccharibacillus sp. O16]|nr:hypothetical protein B9G55_18130 [Saccharibacillus sp. O16]
MIQLLLRVFIVKGKVEFIDKKLQWRYHLIHAGVAAVLLVPALLFLYRLPEQSALPSTLGMLALICVFNAIIDLKYIRETREHVVSGIIAVIYAVLAVGLYLFG